MSEKKTQVCSFLRLMGKNALLFAFNVGFTLVFQFLFGPENVLPSVAICVGLTMIPFTDYGLRPALMAGVTFVLYLGSALVAQLALASPWLALPINLLFSAAILLLISEPMPMKPFISFILCFVFCQATPVPPEHLPTRLLGVALAAGLVAAVTLVVWRRRGYGQNGRSLAQQLQACRRRRSLILRMSVGLAAAMLVGMLLELKRPLWISIVVMSLTQVHLHETLERIKYRSIATVVGIVVFVVVFRILVPQRYSYALVLLMGYLSFFTPEYRHKQVVNAISAVNAALVLLDTTTAIANRVLCLLAGIGIVLALFGLEKLLERLGRIPPEEEPLLTP